MTPHNLMMLQKTKRRKNAASNISETKRARRTRNQGREVDIDHINEMSWKEI